jgi:hypothetical protein
LRKIISRAPDEGALNPQKGSRQPVLRRYRLTSQ